MHRRWIEVLLLVVAMALPGAAGPGPDGPRKGTSWFREADPAMNRAIR